MSTPHILIFPFPAQGHMLALLDLAHRLSLRSLSITILITPKNFPFLTPLLSTHPTIQTLILPFPTHHHPATIPYGVEHMKDLPFSGFPYMIYALGKLHDPLLEWFKSHPSPPTAVVYDFMLGWTLHVCRLVGVCGYAFSPSNGLYISIFYTLWRDKPTLVQDDDNKNEVDPLSKIPGSSFYPWRKEGYYRIFVENKEEPIPKFIESVIAANLSSDGLILNSFGPMEDVYLAYLKQDMLGHDRVWAVGPLLPSGDDMTTSQRGGSSSISEDEVCKWLDKCENHSVVYVCFGSQVVFTNEQIDALTKALEISGVKFVFVTKGATRGHMAKGEIYGSIPSGFEERVVGRGLLINGWAPQVLILKHPAIGAFLFHSGWNAVLENILLAGVPMLVWPMFADHFTNTALIVDELKIGARVCQGLKTVPDSQELAVLLAKVINEFDEERKRGIEVHNATLAAIREGGSSFNGLNNLVAHLSEIGSNKTSPAQSL